MTSPPTLGSLRNRGSLGGRARAAHAVAEPRQLPAAGLLVLAHALSLGLIAVAVVLSRRGSGSALPLYWISLALLAGSSAVFLLRRDASRGQRLLGVGLLGLTPTLIYRMTDPLLLTGFDEQLHLRTLSDMATGHAILLPNPLLAVSPEFPGLESLTLFVHNVTGLPLIGAVTAVVLIARLLFVFLLFEAVERVSGSARTAGLATIIYTACEQYYFFNTQFAYQTLAIVFALCLVSLTLRAQRVHLRDDRRVVMAAAAVVGVALVITHHVTSWITVSFLLLWTLVVRGRQRRGPVLISSAVVGVGVAGWAVLNSKTLTNYFGPIFQSTAKQVSGYLDGTAGRVLFSDGSGYTTPDWERQLLIVYTAAVCLTAVGAGCWGLARARRSRSWALATAAFLALTFPVTFASRVVAAAGIFGDRSATFLFLPLAVISSLLLVAWLKRRVDPARPLTRLMATVVVSAALVLGFVGGALLGGGPDWEHLPGSYLVEAENRSIDPYTLAAADWADQSLPHGTKITADRIGGDVLAAEGRLWPLVVLDNHGNDPAALYFAPTWTQAQTDLARRLDVGYVYVDQRWADQEPHAGVYFHDNEQPKVRTLTTSQLTKFAAVPGVTVAYRSGPIVIYDIRAVSGRSGVEGWTGHKHAPPPWEQLVIGLLLGLLVAALARSRVGAAGARFAVVLRRESGSATTLTFVAAVCCLAGFAATAAGVSFGPTASGGFVAVLLLANMPRVRRAVLAGARGSGQVRGVDRALCAAAVLVAVVAIAVSVVSAYHQDVTRTHQIEQRASSLG